MIEVINYTKIIQKKVVLDKVNCSFEYGKAYGLSGTNGSGKTMLMRAIAGLILPTEGQVLIDGQEISGKHNIFPPSIGVLIENPAFIDGYTGLKNLELLASIQKRITKEDVRVAISKVGLDPDDKRKYRKYSLGMRQKLGIAAAIMEIPRIVILDEPLNALDEDGVCRVHQIVADLKEAGSLVIIACHDSDELYKLVDHIYHIESGRIVSGESVR